MKHLFIFLFITGVVPVIQAVDRKYYLILERKTWSDAQAYCRVNYTDLATIESPDERVQLLNLALSQNFISSAWIGLYNDVNSWRWSIGNQPLGSFTYWSSPNPDNYLSEEYCAAIYFGGWFDVPCATLFPVICFDDRYTNNSRYVLVSTSMPWSEAQSYCRLYHTDLASVGNQSENGVLLAMSSWGAWFGLFRDSWKWSDNTKFTDITWMPGKPDNALVHENCVSVTNGEASDELCTDVNPFFCYSIITGQQFLRVKVQSSQDVNDPAVKAAMLDKIKQKLSDHGSFTVNWREQPDGLVFNKIQEDSPVP